MTAALTDAEKKEQSKTNLVQNTRYNTVLKKAKVVLQISSP